MFNFQKWPNSNHASNHALCHVTLESLWRQSVFLQPSCLGWDKTWVRSLGREDPLEKVMATHSSILSWRIPRTEKPGGLQSMRSQRVGHNWATNTFPFSSGHQGCKDNKMWSLLLRTLLSTWWHIGKYNEISVLPSLFCKLLRMN